MSRCFFIGHREAPETILPPLISAVERHIAEYHVNEFVVGHYGSFDRFAQKAVMDAKKRFSDVALTILLPYHPSEQAVELPEGADGFLYPEGMERVPKRAAISRANRYMIAHSDYLIAFLQHFGSNTREFVEYAQKREKQGLLKKVTLLEN